MHTRKILFTLIIFLAGIIPPVNGMEKDMDSPFVDDRLSAFQDSVNTAEADTSDALVEINPGIVSFQELFSVNKIILSFLVLLFTFLLNRLLVFLLERLSENRGAYRLLIKRLIPFLNITLWALAIYTVIAGVIEPPVETVLTVAASVGIAVGFAAQDILKNIFGGFIIILDRPFQVGDKIEVNDHYGEVTQIGLRSTRLVTPDDSAITVPNAEIVNNSVSNTNSGFLFCQVVAEIYVPAKVNITELKEIAYKAAISSRYVYLNKPVVVLVENVMQERNFALKLKIKAYVLDIRYEFLLKSEITELILEELNRRELIPTLSNSNGDRA